MSRDTRSSLQSIMYYLACCNFIDGVITYWGVQNNVIEEANPLMNLLFSIHPSVFLCFKIIMSILLVFMGSIKNDFQTRLIRWLLNVAIVLYTAILLYHAYWLFLL
ncbi:DUF5658 family protein [Alkalihalobacillus sp. CinArs1]|uniref:DUF5658 family protein n=1 Tax=Alkalihalobacillus sp. CinArs1 TaxID=2995314 RepID=UPI0022DDB575|nr:DUF5658 family protein [Alkalihalobacillus sp. CinArs1]